jgi:REP-associated tyrosine transposase
MGFDPAGPMRIYSRHLPHWRQQGVTYFVTFRLADSLPQSRLRELAALRAQWERQHVGRNPASSLGPVSRVGRSPTSSMGKAAENWEKLARCTLERVESWLDEGYGTCVLKEKLAADCLEQKLRHFDGQQYDLGAFVIMPNHVHLLVKPYSDEAHPLERLEQGWKAYSSREINRARGTSGALWQEESFDRIVRDEEHLWYCVQYIGSNPRRAGLNKESSRRWIRPDWVAAGWAFEDS